MCGEAPNICRQSEKKQAKNTADGKDFTENDGATLGVWFKGRQPPTSSVTYADGKFTLEVSGSDIGGTHDEFVFAYKSVGNADLIARVDEQEATNGWAKAGVMVRSGLDDDSAYVFCFVKPENGVVVELRGSDGGNQSGVVAQIQDANAPHWVRIQRTGTGVITCWQREDGNEWQELARLIERINTALMQNNLPVRLQQIHWQKIAVVRWKTCSIAKQCVSYHSLPIGAIKAVVGVVAAVVIAVYLNSCRSLVVISTVDGLSGVGQVPIFTLPFLIMPHLLLQPHAF